MKYLFIILAIVSLATVGSLFFFIPDKSPAPREIAISINGHDIAKDAVTMESQRSGYHSDGQAEVFDTLITRELLIQEAERQEINKEESFRKELKQFYESSLIKILLDRKTDELAAPVTENDVANYIALCGKVVTFSRLDTIPKSPAEASTAKGLTNTALFNDLATPIRMLLSTLQSGQFGIQFDTGTEKYAIRLDQVLPSPDALSQTVEADKDHATVMFEKYKREQQINQWLADLKQKATITIHNEKK